MSEQAQFEYSDVYVACTALRDVHGRDRPPAREALTAALAASEDLNVDVMHVLDIGITSASTQRLDDIVDVLGHQSVNLISVFAERPIIDVMTDMLDDDRGWCLIRAVAHQPRSKKRDEVLDWAIQNPESNIRDAVCLGLSDAGEASWLPKIKPLLDDPSDIVRLEAKDAVEWLSELEANDVAV